MPKSEFTKEEELVILEDGMKGQFWLVYSSWLMETALTSGGAALSSKCDIRDWQAGHASGLKQALQRPSERIRDLKRYLAEQKSK
jgi:hypothetical protein